MKVFKYSIFLSAFLLFQVQPMIARYILPWYGGSASVWSTCLLFFQAGLLLGYGYSHALTKYFEIKKQVTIHIVLLVISLITLPITPGEWLKPQTSDHPVLGIISLLTITVGFPYVMVSTTGPLIQYWFSISYPKKSPYGLYALSNLGSLLGLISYPLIIEPYLHLKTQTMMWSVGYLVYVLICSYTAYTIRKTHPEVRENIKHKSELTKNYQWIFWLLLSFLGVFNLLSISNKLTQDLVVVPFLWIIPLSLYLVSFIIAFGKPQWYNRTIFFISAFIILTVILKMELQFEYESREKPIQSTIIWYCLATFNVCMILHGELARIKPKEENLTLYYLMISMGGVLGGIMCNFFIPIIFDGFWEIYLGFAGFVVLTSYLLLKNETGKKIQQNNLWFSVGAIVLLLGILISYVSIYTAYNKNVIASSRNFYGVLRVTEEVTNTENRFRKLMHGDIMHGGQFIDERLKRQPVNYYGPTSGIGLSLSSHPSRLDSANHGLKVGMIGLGVGCIAVYGQNNDQFRYYEINPLVEDMARKYFSYLGDSKFKTDVIIADGRTALERELKENGSQKFDVLAIDAFTGDMIPSHLLTKEAIELYLKHLKNDGILLFNITNKYLNIFSVLDGHSKTFNIPVYFFQQIPDNGVLTLAYWGVLTRNSKFINQPQVKKNIVQFDSNAHPDIFWTDDYSSILPLIWTDEDFK
jgi:Ca2+/Na+ antiporter